MELTWEMSLLNRLTKLPAPMAAGLPIADDILGCAPRQVNAKRAFTSVSAAEIATNQSRSRAALTPVLDFFEWLRPSRHELRSGPRR